MKNNKKLWTFSAIQKQLLTGVLLNIFHASKINIEIWMSFKRLTYLRKNFYIGNLPFYQQVKYKLSNQICFSSYQSLFHPGNEIFDSGNCLPTKFPFGEMSVRGMSFGALSIGEMSVREIVRSSNCPSGKCPSEKRSLGKYPSGNCPDTKFSDFVA